MKFRGFTLDKFQEDSVKEVEKNNSVVVSAPTGSGKTLIADYLIENHLKQRKSIVYTAPIKALSNQKYKEFCELVGKEKVGLMTGDITINHNAPLLIMTTEIFRNMVITSDPSVDKISYVILDEIHYINDIERGHIWEESIIFSPKSMRFLCLSATIPNAEEFSKWVESIKGHKVTTIHHDIRYVPLHMSFYTDEHGISSLEDIRDIPVYYGRKIRGKRGKRPKINPPNHVDLVNIIKDKTPILFFSFSRALCQKHAEELSRKNVFKHNPEITKYVREKLSESSEEVNKLDSTRILRRILPFGIGFHHAGLIPQIKEIVEGLFSKGLIKVLYATETFAVGINMPAKTVCFDSLRKFDGFNFRFLNSKEYFQMAGRAGRRGIDKEGFVYSMIYTPTFDYGKIKSFTTKDVEPLKSQFRLEVNAVLNLEMHHSKEEIDKILTYSLYSFQNKKDGNELIKRKYKNIIKLLKKMDYISQEGKLTWKGKFASSIFCDEILISEVFATDFYKKFNLYQTLMFLATLVYEHKQRTKIYEKYPSKDLSELKKIIKSHDYLGKEKRFRRLNMLSGIINPCFNGEDFFQILDRTNLLEGDLIRFFSQMLDRINQINKATNEDDIKSMMTLSKQKIDDCLQEISRY